MRVFRSLCTQGCRSSRPPDLCIVSNQCCSWGWRGGGRGIFFRRGGSGGGGLSTHLTRNGRETNVYISGILHRGDRGSTRGQEVNGRVLPAEVGFPLYHPVGVIEHQVLTILLAVSFDFRAQQRVAQQRIDSRIPLGKLIDLRKKIFANVKVCISSLLRKEITVNDVTRASQTWVHRSVTNAQSRKSGSPPIAKYLPLVVGQGM